MTVRTPACHSLVVRARYPVDREQSRTLLEQESRERPEPAGSRLWTLPLAVDSSIGPGHARVRQEAERPLHPCGPPLRAVLVEYADGVVDAVLVARRSVPYGVLVRLAALLLDGEPLDGDPPPSFDAPDAQDAQDGSDGDTTPLTVPWGLGDRQAPDRTATGTVPLTDRPEWPGEEALVAAAALALARYQGGPEARVAVFDRAFRMGGPAVRSVRVDADGTVADLLAAGTGTPLPGAAVASVGVVLGDAASGTSYTPFPGSGLSLLLHLERQPDGTCAARLHHDPRTVAPPTAEWFGRSVLHLARRLRALPGTTPTARLGLLDHAAAEAVTRLGGFRPAADPGEPAPAGPGPERRTPPETIDGRIAELARQRPDAVAVTDDESSLTYGQLDDRAERVAAGLRALGVGGARVGVCLERDTTLVATLLGVLKAGCAYVPMDARYPEERLRYTATDARVPVVIGDPARFPRIEGVTVVSPQELMDAQEPLETGKTGNTDTAAYVIYTSGSTGRPKGVVVPHRNVLALVGATSADLGLGPDDVWTFFHSSAFDFSVWEIWGCLLTGGRLVVVPHWAARDPDEFHELLARRRVTVLSQTPSAFSQLIEADTRSAPGAAPLALRLVVFGGEPLNTAMLGRWFARHSPARCRLVNMYGITETTVHVTAQEVTPREVLERSRSVGRALPGWWVSVRDEHGHVLPPGPAGEIYVGGAGVADGYLGRPELTADRFVDDPVTGERVYRSGDRGRLRPDGRLDHLGRLDNQVKVRGHRIELDEITSVLASDPGVADAAVVFREGEAGDPAGARIDAYVVLRDGGSVDQVWRTARRVLPDHMLPAGLTGVSGIPLTLNGKPDLSRLPAPSTGPTPAPAPTAAPAPAPAPVTDRDGATADPEAKGGDLGTEILAVWSGLLGVDVEPDGNFFELGGNSLLVVRMLSDLRQRGLPKVTPREFYGNSTARSFVELVLGRVGETP
ncbi:amino acid adenylation domain-containing protein [Kitasatospora xanthocidica]|uniref:Amino acid adenylation domain-containing protein n=1 Tax=Kitasatospora xanthocidica TaxID=83382 RepID=A0A373A1V2_9ACTN|nr:amino acid adenylation domain-containing protein [Kitasatospora xanthocidica]RGD62103.1 amino acid adenylation domain-containing protein [Kitasatospora xanthocidica]